MLFLLLGRIEYLYKVQAYRTHQIPVPGNMSEELPEANPLIATPAMAETEDISIPLEQIGTKKAQKEDAQELFSIINYSKDKSLVGIYTSKNCFQYFEHILKPDKVLWDYEGRFRLADLHVT